MKCRYRYQNVLEKRIEKFVKATTDQELSHEYIQQTAIHQCQCIVNQSLVNCHRSRISKKRQENVSKTVCLLGSDRE